ncbi:MAG: hypothetical protein NTU98_07525 [Bacteroidetes bacterium]|nr:hypothetical protein [Bacteroidota bacterium]
MTNNYNILIRKLDEFIRKYYRNQVIRGTLLFLAILLFSSLLFVTIEYFLHTGILPRTILFYLFIVLNGSSFLIFIADPLLKLRKIGRIISHEQAARIIGEHFGEIKDKLLNTLQLKRLENSAEENIELLKAGIDQKIIQLRPIPFVRAIDLKKNKKFLKYTLPPLFVFLLLLLVAPSMITQPSARIIHHSKVYAEEMPFHMVVLNRTLEAFQQEDFTLNVKVTGEKLPDELFLECEGVSYRLTKVNPNLFSYTFKTLQKTLKFFLVAGKFRSEEYELKVYPKPTILNFEAGLAYPPYLSRKNEVLENTGDLIIPEGTRVTWRFFTKDVDRILVRFGNDVKSLEKHGSNAFEYSSLFEKSVTYSMKAENAYKRQQDSLGYTITVIPDSYPSITVEQQKDSVLPSRMFFMGVIRDDYGFSRLSFVSTLTHGEDTANREIKTVSLVLNKTLNQQNFYYSFDISDLVKNPGDELDYYFEVCDNDGLHGAKCARSGLLKYKAPTPEEIDKITSKQEENIVSDIQKSVKEAKEIQKKIDELNKKLVEKNSLSWQDKKQIQDLLDRQKQIKENVEKIQQQYQEKNELENQFKDVDQSLLDKQNQINELFDQVMDEDTKKLAEELRNMLDKIDKNQVSQMLEKLKMSNKDIEKELDRNLEILKQAEFDKRLTESIDKLKDLSERQDKLAESTLDKKNDKDQLQNQQKELKNEFDEAKEKLKDLEEKNKQLEEPNEMPDLSKEQQEIENDMNNSMESMEKNDRSGSGNSKKSASKKMNSMSQKLQSAQEGGEAMQNEEDLAMLRQILENLVRISFSQEELMNRTRIINRSDPKYLKLIQDQNNLKEDLSSVEDSLYQLAKRQLMIKPFILREISSINKNIADAVKGLNDRNLSTATTKQQFAMTSVNNLALMLSEAMKQMESNMQSMSSKQGSSSCNKPGGKGGKKPSMKSMRGMQEQLNKQIQGMMKELQNMKDGKPQSGQAGQKKMSEQLARMAAQQEAIRNEMGKYADQLNEQGIKDGGDLNDMMKKMDQTQKDLVNRRITQETLNRQQEITTKMLESEKAELKRGQEEKRQSTEAKNPKISNPFSNLKYNNTKTAGTDLLKTVQPSYNYFYKNKINSYFLKFE